MSEYADNCCSSLIARQACFMTAIMMEIEQNAPLTYTGLNGMLPLLCSLVLIHRIHPVLEGRKRPLIMQEYQTVILCKK